MADDKKSFKSIRSPRLYTLIVEEIESRILKGELNAGDRLPPERELAERFGVSRTAVREATRALMEKGLVEVQVGRGTFVVDGTRQAMRDSLNLMLKVGERSKFDNLIEVRELIEPGIAARAADAADEDDIAAMQLAVQKMDAGIDNLDAFIAADMDFHLALAQATRNTLILTLVGMLIDLQQEQRMRVGGVVTDSLQRGQFHHKHILEAVIKHEPEAARIAMYTHLQQIREDIGRAAEIDASIRSDT
jgi:GntR family transcriptional repressor for pyruvate dehydrogenase complex